MMAQTLILHGAALRNMKGLTLLSAERDERLK